MDGNIPTNDLIPRPMMDLQQTIDRICYEAELELHRQFGSDAIGIDPALVLAIIIELVKCWLDKPAYVAAQRLRLFASDCLLGRVTRRIVYRRLRREWGHEAADAFVARAKQHLGQYRDEDWHRMAQELATRHDPPD